MKDDERIKLHNCECKKNPNKMDKNQEKSSKPKLKRFIYCENIREPELHVFNRFFHPPSLPPPSLLLFFNPKLKILIQEILNKNFQTKISKT